jgi:glycosyltransferase involved in cell wall biosynthesis
MHFAIITHVVHKKNKNGDICAYAPYVREMNLWLKYCSKVSVVAPFTDQAVSSIDLSYNHDRIQIEAVPAFQLTSVKEIIRAMIALPAILGKIYGTMRACDHIHLRCPGNMGLLGAIVQILFPRKSKTAKYAGNWDWKSKQPWSYRLQQRLLRNTYITRNIQVLVYGHWPDVNANIKPFFTASYSENEIEPTPPRSVNTKPIKLLFVGGLTAGKQPNLSVAICAELAKNYPVELHMYGDGSMRKEIEKQVQEGRLTKHVYLHGNCTSEEVKRAYQKGHFLIFISRSEGWPKAVAEAMFWGCVPITTRVSCVPEMLGNGVRGSLVNNDATEVVQEVLEYILNEQIYAQKAVAAMKWSRQYTLDHFEHEIKKLLVDF